MSVHNHRAAITGTKGERILKEILNSHGLNLLNKKADFKAHGLTREGRKTFKCPYSESGIFLSDGFIPELNIIVEYKYGEAHGSTEEKIFCDLEKIRDGVYGTEFPLVYIFKGTVEVSPSEGKRCWAKIVANKIKKENLPVEVVFADTDNGLEKWILEKKKALIDD